MAACSLLVGLASALAVRPRRPLRPGPRPRRRRRADRGRSSCPSLPVEAAPTEAQLGVPIYPTAQFIRSFDAGRGQRYYLFGAQASFTEIVNYYRTMLKQRGELVFERPATHIFDVGRFREETMAFPPGVTVKDYAGTGSAGYPNPRPGGQPPRFATVIQVVPAVPRAMPLLIPVGAEPCPSSGGPGDCAGVGRRSDVAAVASGLSTSVVCRNGIW